jgi:speckle-type POZ protein
MDDLDGDEKEETVKHLLVAADRYAMERMKVMCESILCKGLKVETVAETLALADQHNCIKLRDACIGFINSSERMDAVVESSGFQHLKRACPTVFMDMWEKIAKSRRI